MFRVVLVISGMAVLMGAEGAVVATQAMGTCRTVLTDASMDFNKFAGQGKWIYKKMPSKTPSENLDRLYSLELKKSTKRPGAFEATLYYRSRDCKPAVLINGFMYSTGPGHASIVSTVAGKQVTFNFYFLKYVPGKYVYYYNVAMMVRTTRPTTGS